MSLDEPSQRPFEPEPEVPLAEKDDSTYGRGEEGYRDEGGMVILTSHPFYPYPASLLTVDGPFPPGYPHPSPSPGS